MNFFKRVCRLSAVLQIAESEAMLSKFYDEVAHLEHAPMDEKRITALLAQITVPEHQRHALELLAASSNWDCKHFAVTRDPTYGRVCAEEFLSSVRWKLMHSRDSEQLLQSRMQLIMARYWYRCANDLTIEREEEISRLYGKTFGGPASPD